jgi:hypothetical protein
MPTVGPIFSSARRGSCGLVSFRCLGCAVYRVAGVTADHALGQCATPCGGGIWKDRL